MSDVYLAARELSTGLTRAARKLFAAPLVELDASAHARTCTCEPRAADRGPPIRRPAPRRVSMTALAHKTQREP